MTGATAQLRIRLSWPGEICSLTVPDVGLTGVSSPAGAGRAAIVAHAAGDRTAVAPAVRLHPWAEARGVEAAAAGAAAVESEAFPHAGSWAAARAVAESSVRVSAIDARSAHACVGARRPVGGFGLRAVGIVVSGVGQSST